MRDGQLTTADGLRAGYRDTLGNVEALVAQGDEQAWSRPTGCPGWTVRDHVSHIIGIESLLIGRPRPEHRIPDDLPHVRNDPGRFMEVDVDLRRGRPAATLVAEYREVTSARLAALEQVTDDDLDREAQGLFGRTELRNILSIRVFDIWSHEQDIRRALARPGGLDGPAGGHSRERLVSGIAYKVQQTVASPAGTTLVLDITGPGGGVRTIGFDGERGRRLDEVPDHPTVLLRLDLPTLTVLGCGRADDPGARDRVEVEGDTELARRMLADLAFTP